MPHVALWLPTSIKGSRDLLRGVLSYVNLHGHWAVDLIDERNARLAHLDPTAWGYSGMIVDMRDRQRAERLLSAGCPAVVTCVPDEFLELGHPCSRLSRIECENGMIGNKAAEFFLERKFTTFAFVGDVTGADWSIKRLAAFRQRLLQSDFRCEAYPPLPKSEQQNFSKEKNRLCGWLKALPKPVALFAANDARARQILDACLKAGLSVPQEIAVLGVDNDELICETTQPRLSSIQMSTEQAGFEAARVLDRMMRRNPRGTTRQTVIAFGFSQVVTRRSTEPLQIADPLVARAIEFIRINADIVLTIDDIVRHLHVSRRWLEKRFKSVGRTVHAEIMRVRLNRVQTLLRESTMTIDAIADDCGFTSASHLGTLFRRHFNTTPAVYRRQSKKDGV